MITNLSENETLPSAGSSDPMGYFRTLVDPTKFTGYVPDEVLQPCTLKSQTSNYLVTAKGGPGKMLIDYSPLADDDILGCIYRFDPTTGHMEPVTNITKAEDVSSTHNWRRPVSRIFRCNLNTRSGANFDLSGRMSWVWSDAAGSEIGPNQTFSTLLSTVQNIENKATMNVMDGAVVTSFPYTLNQPFARTGDQQPVTSSPGIGITTISSTVTAQDSSESLSYRYINQSSFTPSAPGDFVLSNDYFPLDSIGQIRATVTTRAEFTGTWNNDAAIKYDVTTYDINSVVINSFVLGRGTVKTTTAGSTGSSFTVSGQLPGILNFQSLQRRPIRFVRLITTLIVPAGPWVATTFTTLAEFFVNKGARVGQTRPFVMGIIEGLSEGSVVEFDLSTTDELVPNGDLQRNTRLESNQVHPKEKVLTEVLLGNLQNVGWKRIMTFNEYEEFKSMVENTNLSDDQVRTLFAASSKDWMRKIVRATLRTGRFLGDNRELINRMVPGSGVVLERVRDATEGINRIVPKDYKASSRGIRYLAEDDGYGCSDPEEGFHLIKDDPVEKKVRLLRDVDIRGFVLFPAINKSDGKPSGKLCAVVRGNATPLLNKKEWGKYTRSAGKGKIYGIYSAEPYPERLKEDLTVFSVYIEDGKPIITENFIEVESQTPEIHGRSAWAAIAACTRENLWCKNIAISAVALPTSKNEVALYPVGDVKEKAEFLEGLGIKLITTSSSEPNTVNYTYLRQALNVMRGCTKHQVVVPDRPFVGLRNQGTIFLSSPGYGSKNGNSKIYYAASLMAQRRIEYAVEPEVEDKDNEEVWDRNNNTIFRKLIELQEQLLDIRTVGEKNAEQNKFIFDQLNQLAAIAINKNFVQDLGEVGETVGKGLAHFERYGRFPGSVSGIEINLSDRGERIYNWLRESTDADVPKFSELKPMKQKAWIQYGRYLATPGLGYFVQHNDTVTPRLMNGVKYSSEYLNPISGDDVFIADYYQIAKLAIGQKVPAGKDNLDAMIAILGDNFIGDVRPDENRAIQSLVGNVSKTKLSKKEEIDAREAENLFMNAGIKFPREEDIKDFVQKFNNKSDDLDRRSTNLYIKEKYKPGEAPQKGTNKAAKTTNRDNLHPPQMEPDKLRKFVFAQNKKELVHSYK